jgi:hypothetical protein
MQRADLKRESISLAKAAHAVQRAKIAAESAPSSIPCVFNGLPLPAVFLATSTLVRLLPKNFVFHNRNYLDLRSEAVCCIGAAVRPQAALSMVGRS